MSDGGIAVERATIGRVLLGADWPRWMPARLAVRLRPRLPAIPILIAGLALCASVAVALLFVRGNPRDVLPLLVMFLAGLSIPGLALAIGGRVRKRTERELRRANAEMDRRVQQRTQALDEARQALLQSQRMEALAQLTGGIAHDFNNILTAITSSLEVAREATADARQRERLDRALEAARLGGLSVQQMLVFARKEPLHLQPIDINALVETTVAMFQRSCPENIALTLQLAGGPQWAIADATQVQTAILNLAVNARDAMPNGGRITFSTRREQRRNVGADATSFVCIVVADTGAGMSAEVQARAFEAFFSAGKTGKGTGPGLTMVNTAIQQMGGDATLVSQPGKGTVVRLWLPAADAVSPGAIADVEAPPPALRAADVQLIYVEDDPLVNATTAELLEREGFAVHAAADAAHALRLMDTHPDARALLIDVGLPGMNGFELATVARRSRPDLKVLFLSGHDCCNVKAPQPEDADTRYVVKPYRQQDLFTALRRLLAEPPK